MSPKTSQEKKQQLQIKKSTTKLEIDSKITFDNLKTKENSPHANRIHSYRLDVYT